MQWYVFEISGFSSASKIYERSFLAHWDCSYILPCIILYCFYTHRYFGYTLLLLCLYIIITALYIFEDCSVYMLGLPMTVLFFIFYICWCWYAGIGQSVVTCLPKLLAMARVDNSGFQSPPTPGHEHPYNDDWTSRPLKLSVAPPVMGEANSCWLLQTVREERRAKVMAVITVFTLGKGSFKNIGTHHKEKNLKWKRKGFVGPHPCPPGPSHLPWHVTE